jgi:hypothetical protein
MCTFLSGSSEVLECFETPSLIGFFDASFYKLEGLICIVLAFVFDVLYHPSFELSGIPEACLSSILVNSNVLGELEFDSGSSSPIETL